MNELEYTKSESEKYFSIKVFSCYSGFFNFKNVHYVNEVLYDYSRVYIPYMKTSGAESIIIVYDDDNYPIEYTIIEGEKSISELYSKKFKLYLHFEDPRLLLKYKLYN